MGLTHRVVIPAKTEDAKPVLDQITECARDHAIEVGRSDLATSIEFSIRFAVEETLMNHIKHGSQLDAKKKITVEWQVQDGEIHIHSEDEGEGFNPDEVPDPTDDEGLDLPSGRGIYVTKKFARKFHGDVKYPNGGRRAEILFVVDDPIPEEEEIDS